jgi:hypothetical protein
LPGGLGTEVVLRDKIDKINGGGLHDRRGVLVKICEQESKRHSTPERNGIPENLTFLRPKVIFSKDVEVPTQSTGLVEVSV